MLGGPPMPGGPPPMPGGPPPMPGSVPMLGAPMPDGKAGGTMPGGGNMLGGAPMPGGIPMLAGNLKPAGKPCGIIDISPLGLGAWSIEFICGGAVLIGGGAPVLSANMES